MNADVRLVPALAFDADGHRLGQGGGYYDRLIPLLSAQQLEEQSIGVVFADEIYELFPTTSGTLFCQSSSPKKAFSAPLSSHRCSRLTSTAHLLIDTPNL